MKPAAAVGLLAFVAVGYVFWTAQAPQVLGVHPETETVPSNLLRLYVDFSRPMAGDDAFEHLQLLDSSGRPIEDAFREIELWSRDNRRLMLYVHPGRVKSGLALGDQLGPVIEQGKTYTLRLLPGMKGRNGRPSTSSFARPLQVCGPDHEPPDVGRWTLRATPERLEVDVDEWLDHAGLEDFLSVEGVQGRWRAEGRQALFFPSRRFAPGEYRLVVDARLEDLAGNNFIRPFETPSGATPLPSDRPAAVSRPFRVR
ncbi:MAG TPA: hypothetical protein VE981_10685 [Planctomycetota bacterium]|nr:hypothetical protein [Planctomycetota bacterium]